MKLHTLTISGPDDTTDPDAMLRLSRQFPFVEWGILLSAKAEPRPRYPGDAWIDRTESLAREGVRFCGHICGLWAHEICNGTFPEPADRPSRYTEPTMATGSFLKNPASQSTQ